MTFNQYMIPLYAALVLLPACLSADTTPEIEAIWKVNNQKVADEYIIPAYQAFEKSSKALVVQTHDFCRVANKETLEKTKLAFHASMDEWQRVQQLRLGPSELFMRHFRIEMWPDRSNTAAKQLRKLLAEKDEKALVHQQFSRASTAVQGLSAFERLLFVEDVTPALFVKDKTATYRCHLLEAISQNVAAMSADLLKEWQGSHYKTFTTAGENNDTYENHKEVASLFFNELSTQLQFIVDKKMNRPMDKKRFRVKRAESWRSGRSIRNITLNIEATERLYRIAFRPEVKSEALQKTLDLQFKKAIEAGHALNIPLVVAYKEKPELLEAWKKEVLLLNRLVHTQLLQAVDIVLGFNSLDGD